MSDNEQDMNDNNEAVFNLLEQPTDGGNQDNGEGDETEDEGDELDEDDRAWVADHPNVVIDGVDSGSRLALRAIVVPEGVTRLPGEAFSLCGALTSVILPSSLIEIGSACFKYCWSMKSIDLPNDITTIGNHAFLGSGLTSIVLPNSITSL